MAHYMTTRLSDDGHCRIFNVSSGQEWDRNADVMGAIGTVTSANAAVHVPYTSSQKVGLVTFPSSLPNGSYSVLIYNAAYGDAADSDEAVERAEIRKTSSGIQILDVRVYKS